MDLLWRTMPADIHAHIIMQLDFPTFIAAHLVCQRWRIITQENEKCVLNKFVQTKIIKDNISIIHIDYLPNLGGEYTIRHNYTRIWFFYSKSFKIEIWNKNKLYMGYYEDHDGLDELSADDTVEWWYMLDNRLVLDITKYYESILCTYYIDHKNILRLNFEKTLKNISWHLTNFHDVIFHI